MSQAANPARGRSAVVGIRGSGWRVEEDRDTSGGRILIRGLQLETSTKASSQTASQIVDGPIGEGDIGDFLCALGDDG